MRLLASSKGFLMVVSSGGAYLQTKLLVYSQQERFPFIGFGFCKQSLLGPTPESVSENHLKLYFVGQASGKV